MCDDDDCDDVLGLFISSSIKYVFLLVYYILFLITTTITTTIDNFLSLFIIIHYSFSIIIYYDLSISYDEDNKK